jgi:hypothetical protein
VGTVQNAVSLRDRFRRLTSVAAPFGAPAHANAGKDRNDAQNSRVNRWMDHARACLCKWLLNDAFWFLHGRIWMLVGRVAGARWFSTVYSLRPQLVILIRAKAGAAFSPNGYSKSRTRMTHQAWITFQLIRGRPYIGPRSLARLIRLQLFHILQS